MTARLAGGLGEWRTEGKQFAPRHAHIALKADVSPGSAAAFAVQITAPSQAGIYTSEWQLEHARQPFGPKATIALSVAPQQVKTWWDQLVTWVENSAVQLGRAMIEAVQRAIEQGLREACGGSTTMLILGAVFLLRPKKRSA